MKSFLKNRVVVFLSLAILLFTVWHFSYYYLINPHTGIDKAISLNLAEISNQLLCWMGYDSVVDYYPTEEYIIVRMQDSWLPGVRIGDPCNGLNLFGLFAVVLIAFPTSFKRKYRINLHKLWYIPLGILLIHIVNVIRVAVLAIIASYNYEALNFNHDVTFKVITYSFIFLLWYLWIKQYSGFNKIETKE